MSTTAAALFSNRSSAGRKKSNQSVKSFLVQTAILLVAIPIFLVDDRRLPSLQTDDTAFALVIVVEALCFKAALETATASSKRKVGW